MANVYFGTNSQFVLPGQPVQIGVFLDTEGESVNALQGTVTLPAGANIDHVSDGNSFINMWVETPTIRNGGVQFAGAIPGGFAGKDLYLFSLDVVFSTPGYATITTKDWTALLNDGLGTPAQLTSSQLRLTISDMAAASPVAAVDAEPPEVFVPIITQSPLLYANDYLVVFSTTDKQSGVSHYDVREGYRIFGHVVSGRWQTNVQSPYRLRDQKLDQTIVIRAFDQAGNSQGVLVKPEQPLGFLTRPSFGVILGVGFVLLSLAAKKFWKIWGEPRQK